MDFLQFTAYLCEEYNLSSYHKYIDERVHFAILQNQEMGIFIEPAYNLSAISIYPEPKKTRYFCFNLENLLKENGYEVAQIYYG